MKENDVEKKEKWHPEINFEIESELEAQTFMRFWQRDRVAMISELKYLEKVDDEMECLKVVKDFIPQLRKPRGLPRGMKESGMSSAEPPLLGSPLAPIPPSACRGVEFIIRSLTFGFIF